MLFHSALACFWIYLCCTCGCGCSFMPGEKDLSTGSQGFVTLLRVQSKKSKVPDSKRSSTRGILKLYRNHISRFPGNHIISIFEPCKTINQLFGPYYPSGRHKLNLQVPKETCCSRHHLTRASRCWIYSSSPSCWKVPEQEGSERLVRNDKAS